MTTAEKMKLGMGLYRDMLDRDHFRFARQCGCTHAIVHLANYYTGSDNNIVTATDANHNYGVPSRDDPVWTAEGICKLQELARRNLPLIGDMLAKIVRVVQRQME